MINIILIILFVIENVYLIHKSYNENMGVFSPVFVMSMMSLGQLLPQLTTIYFLRSVYPSYIIPNLVYTMITCNFAFYMGWRYKIKNNLEWIVDINKKWLKLLIILFSTCGVVFTYIIQNTNALFDGVIAFQFQGVGFLGMILSLLYLIKYNRSWIVYLFLIINTFSILEYALTIYGSRQSLFAVFLLYAYFFTKKYPCFYVTIKRIVLIFFIIGSIGSLSISEVRNSMNSDEGAYSNIEDIAFVDNMVNAFYNSYNPRAGMDLGNCALAIDYCINNGYYTYGLFLWNGFVYNYIPRRLVGEDLKNSLMINIESRKYISTLTHGITCTTGYFDAFSSFAYGGFIVYYLMAILFKYIRVISEKSMLLEMSFLFALINSSVATTHGLQLVFSKFEFVILLFLLLSLLLVKKNIKLCGIYNDRNHN